MFTGLIKEVGKVVKITSNTEGKEIFISAPKLSNEIHIDDSVAVNGTCLTTTAIDADVFKIQAVHVTLEKTSIGKLTEGSLVNLELALKPSERLGGHFVQGHVNGTATLTQINHRGDNAEMSFELPQKLMKYMMNEGSIAIDGISLTIAATEKNTVMVSIIPHTWQNTNLHQKKIGDIVNIEADVLAKYIENLLKHGVSSTQSGFLNA